MKKIIFLCALVATFLTSCEKDEIGGTAIQKFAGEWYVTVDAVDANGEVVVEDFFELGQFNIITYNTAENVPTKMWINDNELFWDFKVIVDLDYAAGAFSTKDFVENHAYDSKVKISNGKILFGAAVTPSGMPADSIVLNISFDDDPYPDTYHFAQYKISGYRYTGFVNDN